LCIGWLFARARPWLSFVAYKEEAKVLFFSNCSIFYMVKLLMVLLIQYHPSPFIMADIVFQAFKTPGLDEPLASATFAKYDQSTAE
jgi:hypothetical protein